MAVPGIKAEGSGLRQAALTAWAGDRSRRRIAVRLLERSIGGEAEELEAPKSDPR